MAEEHERLPVAVVGAEGRLGRAACDWIEADPGLELVARLGRVDEDSLEERCARSTTRVALDVTVAGLGAAHGLRLLRAGVRPVIGTSGVSEDEVRALDAEARARGLGGLVVPNFSLGAALLGRAASLVAESWPAAAAIVETHHAEKRDAPSGTAHALARTLQEAARRGAGGTFAPEPEVRSLRLAGADARHEVRFSRPGEELVLDHRVSAPEAYRAGLLLALRHAARCEGVVAGLATALSGPVRG